MPSPSLPASPSGESFHRSLAWIRRLWVSCCFFIQFTLPKEHCCCPTCCSCSSQGKKPEEILTSGFNLEKCKGCTQNWPKPTKHRAKEEEKERGAFGWEEEAKDNPGGKPLAQAEKQDVNSGRNPLRMLGKLILGWGEGEELHS